MRNVIYEDEFKKFKNKSFHTFLLKQIKYLINNILCTIPKKN